MILIKLYTDIVCKEDISRGMIRCRVSSCDLTYSSSYSLPREPSFKPDPRKSSRVQRETPKDLTATLKIKYGTEDDKESTISILVI